MMINKKLNNKRLDNNHIVHQHIKQFFIRSSKKTFSAAILGMLLLNLTGCGIFPKEESTLAPPLIEPAPVKYDQYEVKKGTIESDVSGSAEFQSENLSNESFKYSVSYIKSINVKVGDTVKAGQVLAEQETDSLANNLKKVQLKLKADQLNLDKITNDYNNAVDDKTKFDLNIQLQQQQINIDLDKIDVEEAQKGVDRSQLKASISGTVVYIDTINAGDKVTPNKTVITIADPSKLILQYSENNTSQFYVGGKVTIQYNSKNYAGTILTDTINLPTDASDKSKKVLKIKLDSIPAEAKIGDSASINLVLQKKENVIVIPNYLVKHSTGRTYVEMLVNGLRVQRDVEIGLQTQTDVEIVKGLNEGDKILKN